MQVVQTSGQDRKLRGSLFDGLRSFRDTILLERVKTLVWQKGFISNS